MLHGGDVEAGVQPRVSTGLSIHAVPSITPSPREGIEDGPRLRADPLGLSNWQLTQKTAFDVQQDWQRRVHRRQQSLSRASLPSAAPSSHPRLSPNCASFDARIVPLKRG
jgi:hypothetical protein